MSVFRAPVTALGLHYPVTGGDQWPVLGAARPISMADSVALSVGKPKSVSQCSREMA